MKSSGSGVQETTVLVVEDEASIRLSLVYDLEDAGFRVIGAKDADAAMSLIESRTDIQVVVTDVGMPGSVDGMGLAHWMRDHAAHIPIIIATAFSGLVDLDKVNPAIVRVVIKPYSTDTIVACLKLVHLDRKD